MKKIKGYWGQFWHCLIPRAGHRGVDESEVYTMTVGGREITVREDICLIGCECGKIFYKKEGYESRFLKKNDTTKNKL